MSLFLFVGLAHALSTLPGEVSTYLGMECAPSCLLCHTSPAGGSGTASQPFAIALLAEGLLISDSTSTAIALDAVLAAGTTYDANDDGVNDVAELTVGENPNPGGIDFCPEEGEAPPAIERGCFAGGDTAAGAAGVLVTALMFRRRRRGA